MFLVFIDHAVDSISLVNFIVTLCNINLVTSTAVKTFDNSLLNQAINVASKVYAIILEQINRMHEQHEKTSFVALLVSNCVYKVRIMLQNEVAV